jgi:hypothetical protein
VRANDVGVVLDFPLNGLGFSVPGGSTGTLLAAPGYPFNDQPVAIGPVTFSADGTQAFYTTQGNGLDFQSGGNWIVMVQIFVPGANGPITTPPGQLYVSP